MGGPEVMRAQVDRILRDIGLPSLTLGIVPPTARLEMFPVPAFGIYGDGNTVHVELVSSGLAKSSSVSRTSSAPRSLSGAAVRPVPGRSGQIRRNPATPAKAGSKQASASRWSTSAPCNTSTGRSTPCST
ncbi:Scr1 family TA system antitoxin-like transcriptional regulator [Streptomyces lasiicapitis]|uniref:Scr1 family TA system antitoxin-like transcriptional regulator n=1 Tax=Streptomyces lasiicapitis TaxID=1923961 RepID=UPI00368BBF43